METLLTWLDKFNESYYLPSTWTLEQESINALVNSYDSMVRNLYVKKDNTNDDTNFPLRPSMLGKPAMVIAYNYYHPGKPNPFPNPNARMASIGYYFEQWVYAKLLGLGYKVKHDTPNSLIWHDTLIEGHTDFIIESPDSGKQLIIECKELSDYYYKQWTRYTADDDRGYLTQAAFYSTAYNLPIMWILGNRATGQISYRVQPPEEREHYINRAMNIVDTLINKTSCWEECFKYIEPEAPNVTKKGLTVPFAMKPISDVVYRLDPDGYVLDYNYPKGYEDYKPKL